MLPLLLASNAIPAQSPAAGAEPVPSEFVSPPTLSSFSEVNTIGASVVPRAIRVPPMNNCPPLVPLMLTPGAMVSVTPSGTVTGLVSTYALWSAPQTVSWLSVPQTSTDPRQLGGIPEKQEKFVNTCPRAGASHAM